MPRATRCSSSATPGGVGANPAGIDREDRSSNDQSQPCPQKQDDEREQHGCHARDSQRARARTRTAEGVAEGVRAIAIAMSNSVRESHRREKTRATETCRAALAVRAWLE